MKQWFELFTTYIALVPPVFRIQWIYKPLLTSYEFSDINGQALVFRTKACA